MPGVIMFISPYEFVAHSVHGKKKSRLVRNWVKLLPNPYDMSIHRPGSRKVLIPPNLVEQSLAAQCFPGVTQEMLQQLKFLAGKLHRVTATRYLVAPQIHVHITKCVAVLLFRECLCPA